MSDFQDIHDIVRELNAALGPTLVAGLSGSKDRRLPIRWAKADGPEPRPEAAHRLTFAHRQWRLLAAADGAQVARQWFIGGNPHLSENTPITAIREVRYAFQITQLLGEAEPDEVIRAWFMGMNPQLSDESPVDALREGRARDAMAAARAFVNAG